MNIHFKRVIVIGCGNIALNVLKYAFENSEKYGYDTEFVEYGKQEFSSVKRYAVEHRLAFDIIKKKEDMLPFFIGKADERLLIISAGNFYLFPKELIDNENVKIINFHNALLPDYPGRNAESWVIYENQKVTGITWHYVNENIDDGSIIIQKSCDIGKNIKAYELSKLLMELAFEAFVECFAEILTDSVVAKPQQRSKEAKVYKSFEVPGDAYFNLDDGAESIYCLLRALDYGKNRVFPMVTTKYQGDNIRIKRYKIVDEKNLLEMDKRLYLKLKDGNFLMLFYEIIDS